jgi:putative ABC transport system substrate-binding protein
LHVVQASTTSDIRTAFDTTTQLQAGALIVNADLFLHSQREQILALVAKHTLPTIYAWREYVAAGGLMSYGPSLFDSNRLIGVYCGKILKST